MKHILHLSLLLVLLPSLCDAQSISDCTPPAIVPDSLRAFDPGEKVEYVIQYRCLGIRSDVGNARIILSGSEPRDGRSVFHAVASGETVKFFDAFFKVRDTYEAKFFADNGRSIWFHRDIYEGGYMVINDFNWNTVTDQISARAEYVRSGNRTDTLLFGRPCTYDLISMYYAARNMDYSSVEKGRNYPLSFVIDDEMFDIYFRFEGREKKKVPKLGTFDTMKFALKVIAGEVFNGDNELCLWITDDANKIPVWIESPVKVGTVIGRLKGYTNLKHPLASKVEDER